jgi:hypothetical protein
MAGCYQPCYQSEPIGVNGQEPACPNQADLAAAVLSRSNRTQEVAGSSPASSTRKSLQVRPER